MLSTVLRPINPEMTKRPARITGGKEREHDSDLMSIGDSFQRRIGSICRMCAPICPRVWWGLGWRLSVDSARSARVGDV